VKKKAAEWELEYWRKVARDAPQFEEERGTSKLEDRKRVRDKLNAILPDVELPQVTDWWDEDPPELEFYRIAKARGLLRRPNQRD
jgi:hypothetical protein